MRELNSKPPDATQAEPRITCAVCGARPYPAPGSGIRETFSLLKQTPGGKPAPEGEGEWRCEHHRIVVDGVRP